MAGALMKLSCLVLACMVMVMGAEAAITCGTVSSAVGPCYGYLTGSAKLTPQCCGGVKRLNSLAATTPDRQTACRCLQNAAKRIPGLNPKFAAGLPGACGVNIPYPISLNTNCNSVK